MQNNNLENTICAIATAMSESGVGIIRISGKNAVTITQKIFKTSTKKDIDISTSHKIYYGFIYDIDVNTKTSQAPTLLNPIDEVLVLTMLAPKSYTSEDVVEIQAHGGMLILKTILNILLKIGCTLAEPGEFTKRAFLNGRIDLAKAESVADFIASKNNLSMQTSFKQLKGDLSNKINQIRSTILESNAFIEAALDDPEHIEIAGFTETLKPKIQDIISNINYLLQTFDDGKIIKEGIKTVILGKPNAGKSSLLNLLVKKDRAIVTDIAGTTRDTLEESINLNGFNLNIIDTAGIREDSSLIDAIEKIGIEKALSEAKNADLILFVIDLQDLQKNTNTSKNNISDLYNYLDSENKQIYDFLQKNDKKFITILNKTDICDFQLPTNNNIQNKTNNSNNIIYLSTITKNGFDNLTQTIQNMFLNNQINYNDELFITNERHKNNLEIAKNYLQNVINSINDDMPEDFLTIDLMGAYSSLSEILGEEVSEDLINEIFSKFCMGK